MGLYYAHSALYVTFPLNKTKSNKGKACKTKYITQSNKIENVGRKNDKNWIWFD